MVVKSTKRVLGHKPRDCSVDNLTFSRICNSVLYRDSCDVLNSLSPMPEYATGELYALPSLLLLLSYPDASTNSLAGINLTNASISSRVNRSIVPRSKCDIDSSFS